MHLIRLLDGKTIPANDGGALPDAGPQFDTIDMRLARLPSCALPGSRV